MVHSPNIKTLSRRKFGEEKDFSKEDVEFWKVSCRLASCLSQIADECHSGNCREFSARMKKQALALPDDITSLILASSMEAFEGFRVSAQEIVSENKYTINFLYSQKKIAPKHYQTAMSRLNQLEMYLLRVAFYG